MKAASFGVTCANSLPPQPSDKHFLPCDTGEDLKGRYIPAVLLYDEKVSALYTNILG